MKMYVIKLYTVLFPSLVILIVFGTIGELRANDNYSEFENVKDIIAIYPSQLEVGNTEITPDDYLYFNGEIIKVKDCFVDFRSSDGQKYRIPGYDIMGYRLEDPMSKWEEALLEMIVNPEENCMAGRMDAAVFHKRKFGNFVGGILLGPFWVIGAAIWSPDPGSGRDTYIMSDNKDLFSDPYYLDCYKRKARSNNVIAALGGWATWILFALIASASYY